VAALLTKAWFAAYVDDDDDDDDDDDNNNNNNNNTAILGTSHIIWKAIWKVLQCEA
jgi:hypothetical protein